MEMQSSYWKPPQRQIEAEELHQRQYTLRNYPVERKLMHYANPVERKLMHYSNFHSILLVGEGDYSFSSALATAFVHAENIVSTSLDSREKVLRLYQSARTTICNLVERGAVVLHGIDARRLDQLGVFRGMIFDRIVFNFPHAGFWGKEDNAEVIKKHRDLVSMFLQSASMLLSTYGEIHVAHKEGEPYNRWNLVEEALEYGLILKESVTFRITDYPGYTNKRGDGARIADSFSLGACKTCKFMLTPAAFRRKELLLLKEPLVITHKRRYIPREDEEYRHVKRRRINGIYDNEQLMITRALDNVTMDVERATVFNDPRIHRSRDPKLPCWLRFNHIDATTQDRYQFCKRSFWG